MKLEGKRIMVTGGAGFIGSHLVDRLIKENPEKIMIIDNFFLGKQRNIEAAMKESDTVKLYYQDAGHYEKMQNLLKMEKIDVVFNMAVVPLLTSHDLPKITCEDNLNIALTMLELQREGYYETLIHISSSEAYGSALVTPMDETHPLNPTTPYAASKAASDLLVQSYHNTFKVDVSIARPFNNFGPRQNEGSYAGIVPITIERVLSGKPPIVYGDGLQTRDYIYVKDVVEGLIKLYGCQESRGKVVNLATGKEITILEIANAIKNETGFEGEIDFQPERKADVRRHCGDITLAKELIDFSPQTSFKDGIKETVSWYKQLFSKKSINTG